MNKRIYEQRKYTYEKYRAVGSTVQFSELMLQYRKSNTQRTLYLEYVDKKIVMKVFIISIPTCLIGLEEHLLQFVINESII